MSKASKSLLVRVGTGLYFIGLIFLGALGLLLTGIIGPSGGGHTVPSGDPSLGIIFILTVGCSVLSFFVGFIVKTAGKQKAAAPDKDINGLAFISVIFAGLLIPVVCVQWGVFWGDGLIDTSPYFNQNPLEGEGIVRLLIGRVDWGYLAWICLLPVVSIVVSAFAIAKAHKLGGVAIWKARSGLLMGIAALLPILSMISSAFQVIDEVQTFREETETYIFGVDKVNLHSASMRIGVGTDGQAECERLKVTGSRCLCLIKGGGFGDADSLSCVPCDLELFSECDGWLDDEVLDKFYAPPFSSETPNVDLEKARTRLAEETAGWTQGLGVFKILPESESTGLQIELTVRSGTQDRCCGPASRYSQPNADGNLRCNFRCFSTNYSCAYGVSRLLLDGQTF